MTEDRGRRGARRGAIVISALAPGLPQLLRGRLVGGVVLVLWSVSLSLAVLRRDGLKASLSGGWDGPLAAVTLLCCLAGAWTWSWWDLGRGPKARDSEWTRAWRSFASNRMAVLGLFAVGALTLVALLAPFLAPFDPLAQPADLSELRLAAPSGRHWLGTDQFARDVLSRLLHGARISLTVGLVAVGISVTVGTALGALAGYLGGWPDVLVMRLVDVIISFPRLVLLIAVVALFPPSILLIVTVLGLTLWPATARLVRSEVLSLRDRGFVRAARALGFSHARIVLRHVIPNALAPVIVVATLGVGDTIVLEAGLSFLGIGVQPPTPSWGTMVADGRGSLLGAWWLTTFPGLAIVVTVLAFNLVGEGLRDALDPRTER